MPLTIFDDDPRLTWLFAFAHPDDEIAICAWIRRLTESGAKVWAGWSVSNPGRENEARKVMSFLGVPQESLFFFDMPDGNACEHLSELSDKWKQAILTSTPDRVAVCAFECGHLDHDATNFAINSAIRATGMSKPVFEIPLYHTYLSRIPRLNRFADSAGEQVLLLKPDEWRLKARVSRSYPSQNIASLLVWYTVLNLVKLRPAALCRTERMRLQTHYDFLVPNLPPSLRNRVENSVRWRRWADGVRKAVNSL